MRVTKNTAQNKTRINSAALFVLGILTVTALLYLPGLHGPFVFDDLTNIMEAKAIRIQTVDFESLAKAAYWQETSLPGRPIAMITFALNYYFHGYDTFGFKVTNLAIHLLNSVLVWLLTLQLLERFSPKKSVKRSYFDPTGFVALVVMGIWAVHPLNLTSVLYVVQRMTSLATMFILLGLLGYTIGRRWSLERNQKGLPVAAASLVFLGLLATLTKEIGVVIFLYAFIIEIVAFKFDVGRTDKKNYVKWSWIFLLIFASIASIAQHEIIGQIFSYQYRDFTMGERVMTEARVLWFYIKLIFLPANHDMAIHHDDFGLSTGFIAPVTTLFSVIGTIGLITIAILSYRRFPVVFLGIGWFLVGHSLESTIVPLELVHEHRNYLPQYGLIFMFTYYLTAPNPAWKKTLRWRQGFAIVLIGMLSSVTFARSMDWKDEWTLYSTEVAKHPESARARTTLGVILSDNQQHTMAHEQFVAAAQLAPTDPTTMIRLVQHTQLTQGKVPAELIDELENRLKNYPYSGITLWTYEPLLKNTFTDKALHQRLRGIYERLIQRTDITLDNKWREHGLRTLAFSYRESGDYRMALYYLDRARELTDSHTTALLTALTQLKLGNKRQARLLLERVEPHESVLDEEDRKRLHELRAHLSTTH